MTAFLKISGLAKLNSNLSYLSGREAKKVIRSATRAGAGVIVKQARLNLPAEYDTLKRSLFFKFDRQRSPVVLTGKVGPHTEGNAKFNGWYAHLVEFGIRPHDIPNDRSNKKTRGTKILNVGDDVFATSVKHPGVKAVPFLRPAFDTTFNQVQKAYINKMWFEIRKRLK